MEVLSFHEDFFSALVFDADIFVEEPPHFFDFLNTSETHDDGLLEALGRYIIIFLNMTYISKHSFPSNLQKPAYRHQIEKKRRDNQILYTQMLVRTA